MQTISKMTVLIKRDVLVCMHLYLGCTLLPFGTFPDQGEASGVGGWGSI